MYGAGAAGLQAGQRRLSSADGTRGRRLSIRTGQQTRSTAHHHSRQFLPTTFPPQTALISGQDKGSPTAPPAEPNEVCRWTRPGRAVFSPRKRRSGKAAEPRRQRRSPHVKWSEPGQGSWAGADARRGGVLEPQNRVPPRPSNLAHAAARVATVVAAGSRECAGGAGQMNKSAGLSDFVAKSSEPPGERSAATARRRWPRPRSSSDNRGYPSPQVASLTQACGDRRCLRGSAALPLRRFRGEKTARPGRVHLQTSFGSAGGAVGEPLSWPEISAVCGGNVVGRNWRE